MTNYSASKPTRAQVWVYFQDQVELGRLRLIGSGRYDWHDQNTLNPRTGAVTPLRQAAFTGRAGTLLRLRIRPVAGRQLRHLVRAAERHHLSGAPFDPTTGRQVEAGLRNLRRGLNALFIVSAYDLRRRRVVVGDPLAGTAGIPATS